MADESDSKKYLKSILDFEGDDFFGTGLSFNEFALNAEFKKWRNSLSRITDRQERRRRLKLIRLICVALDEVERVHGVWGTIWVNDGLVAIFNGDWDECRQCAEMLCHEGEDPKLVEIYVKAHAPIRALLLEACDTALPTETDEQH